MRSYLTLFLLSMLLGLLLTRPMMRLGRLIGAMDRTKVAEIPRAGGLAVALATAIAVLGFAAMFAPAGAVIFHPEPRLAATYVGALLILALGVVDDTWRLKAGLKFAVEILIAVGLYYAGLRASSIWLPFGIVPLGNVLGLAFTVIWIVGITNAFNLLDGIDGAAAGAAVFALLAMFAVAVSLDKPLVAFMTVALAGATLGFLPRNFPPATVYLGDAGSLLLGFMLATLAIEGASKGPALVSIAIPIVAFAVPVLDTVIAIVRRAARGAPVFQGDHEHLHHRLLDVGLTPAQAAATLYVVCGAFALASMLLLNPNVRGMAVALTMIGLVVWLAVRHLRLHEFFELARIAQRGLTQTRAIRFNVDVRRAADALEAARSWDEIVGQLAALFDASEFDAVRLRVRPAPGREAVREYVLEAGQASEDGGHRVLADEWGVHIPFQLGPGGAMQGELAVFRRLARRPLLTDVNLLVEVLRPALNAAASRVAPPPLG